MKKSIKNQSGKQQTTRRPGLRSNTKIDDNVLHNESNTDQRSRKNKRKKGEKILANGKEYTGENVIKNPNLTLNHIGEQLTQQVHSPPLKKKKDLILWKRPLLTLNYFVLEVIHLIKCCYLWLLKHYKLTLFIIFNLSILLFLSQLNGPQRKYIIYLEKKLLWCGYWIGLGILSSVGLGTGLHTFLLYLGPHIAAVTLAAYECESLKFPEPPYPEEIVCPSDDYRNINEISLYSIMGKVRLESFMWGVGTALGELPPYFVARASTLSGQWAKGDSDSDISDEDEDEENGSNAKRSNGKLSTPNSTTKRVKHTLLHRGRHSIKILVEKVGFFGILACASIPNPLFDLAGITCGHFLIPFWTFFGATVIGKAIIKMHIQMLFVIIAFNEHHVEDFVELIRKIPYIGKYLHEPFREFLAKQKASLHRKANMPAPKKASWLAWLFEKLVLVMILYFVISIINSMAQSHYERLHNVSEDVEKKALKTPTQPRSRSKKAID